MATEPCTSVEAGSGNEERGGPNRHNETFARRTTGKDGNAMPELPEMQALAERLGGALSGAPLSAVQVMQFSAVKTVHPPLESLAGRELRAVGRRGKYLVFDFEGPRLLIHLSQGGRIEVEEQPRRTRPKASVARLSFERRPSVLVREYGTQRKAGLWVLAPGDDGPLAALGPEPGSKDFERFLLEADDHRRLHTLLRDQKTVAGIGRGYADDILHEARLSPFASLAATPEDDRRRLLAATREVLDAALESERRRTGGLPAKLGGRFRVHGRWRTPCPRCGDPLARVSFEDYEIAYCATCQTGGRVLADRRMSRLLR